jgi:proteasome accessory factor C
MRQIEILDSFEERSISVVVGSEIYEVRKTDTEVLFEVEPEAFGLIADYKPDYEISGNKAVQVKIAIGELGTLGRIVSRYSGKVRVLAPETARQSVREFAQRALGNHKPVPVAE